MNENNPNTFSPAPVFPAQWWRARHVDPERYDFGFMSEGWLEVGLRPTSKVLYCFVDFSRDMYNECPFVFPTATDFLLWLRWCAMPAAEMSSSADAQARHHLTGLRAEVAEMIDAAPAGVDAEMLLGDVLGHIHARSAESTDSGQLWWNVGGLVLVEVLSLGDYLNELFEEDDDGYADELRRVVGLAPQELPGADGVWRLSKERLQALRFEDANVFLSV